MTGSIELSDQDVQDLFACINLALDTVDPDWHISVKQTKRLEDLKERLLKVEVNEY